jgi:hypothetical protein
MVEHFCFRLLKAGQAVMIKAGQAARMNSKPFGL